MLPYPWLKALHIVSVVAWFAGLFYIFRLYVYHVENAAKGEVTQVLSVMERRLYRGICVPALLATAATGLGLLYLRPAALAESWFQLKLVGLSGLLAYHLYAGKVRRDLQAGRCRLSARQCRLINEVPTVLLVFIVGMVVIRPAFW